jgi:hypothetical protein
VTTATDLSDVGMLPNIASLIAQDWTDWTPTYGGGSTSDWTSVTTNFAKYIQLGKQVFYTLNADGTVSGGGVSDFVNFTAPVALASSTNAGIGSGFGAEGGSEQAMFCLPLSTTEIAIKVYDSSTIATGSFNARVSGFYETT